VQRKRGEADANTRLVQSTNQSFRYGEFPQLNPEEWTLKVYSKAYTTTQCCDMLLQSTQPKSAIVFLDRGEGGALQLALALAQIYYGLPKTRREELKLGPDWAHHFVG
jgi:hypothetical protein